MKVGGNGGIKNDGLGAGYNSGINTAGAGDDDLPDDEEGEGSSGKSTDYDFEILGNTTDTGSAEAQIALFSYRISHLTEHLKKNHKDHNTARSLTMLVGKRRKLLKYLYNKDINRYRAIIKALGLRK